MMKDDKNKKEIKLLLLGASGAGKSSFAKTFLLHSASINSTNDGQTTRSNIIYDLSLYESEPSITIRFLTQDNFVTRMIQLNYSNYLLKIVNLIDRKEPSQFKTLEEYLLSRLLDSQNTIIEDSIGWFKDKKNEENIRTLLIEKNKDNLNDILFIERSLFQIDECFEENIETYDKIYELAEKMIKEELSCGDEDERKDEKNKDKVRDFIKSKKDYLNEILLKVEGFFDIQEFNLFFKRFQNNDDFLQNSIELLDDEKGSFSDYFENYYKKFITKL